MQIANDPKMLKIPGVFWKTIIEKLKIQIAHTVIYQIEPLKNGVSLILPFSITRNS